MNKEKDKNKDKDKDKDKEQHYPPKAQEKSQDGQLPVLLHQTRQDGGHRPEDQADCQQVLAVVHVRRKADEDAGESVDQDEDGAGQNLVLQALSVVIPNTDQSTIWISGCLATGKRRMKTWL